MPTMYARWKQLRKIKKSQAMTKKSIKVGAVCISACRFVRDRFALPKERHGIFSFHF